jgi:hypothetical protein
VTSGGVCTSREAWGVVVSSRKVLGIAVVGLVLMLPRVTKSADRVGFTLSSTVLNVFGELHATVRVVPHEENRLLRVSLDGPLYYASTDVQLDGASSARVHDMWWRSLPPGEYSITAMVQSASGRSYTERKVMRVIGGPEPGDSQ